MNTDRRWPRAVLAAVAACVLAGGALPADDNAKARLAKLLQRVPDFPADSKFAGPKRQAAEAIYDEILAGGRDSVLGLVDLLAEPDKGPNFRPRYVLHCLAHYVCGPGRDKQRVLLAEALGSALGGARPTAVQAFVAEQLQVAGRKESAAPLGRILLAGELCESAAQALSAIGGAEAAAALRQALGRAKGATRRTIFRGLGEVRDAKSVGALVEALGDADREVRLTAAYALAAIGSPAASDPMLKAAGTESIYEHGQITAACLLLGRRLVAEGRPAEALRLYKRLGQDASLHVRCGAIRGLGEVDTPEARQAVAEALRSADRRVWQVAVEAAAAMGGAEPAGWLAELKGPAHEERRGLLVRTLGRRTDAAAMQAVLAALKDESASVRQAAVPVLGNFGGAEAVAALIGLLGETDRSIAGMAAGACKAVPGKQATAQFAAAVAGAAAEVKVQLLAILEARGAVDHLPVVLKAADDKDPAVRGAAIRALGALGTAKQVPLLLERLGAAPDDASRSTAEASLAAVGRRTRQDKQVVEAIARAARSAKPETEAALIRALGRIGAPAGLDAIRAAVKDPDPTVQDAAVRALAGWPGPAPAADLLAIAKSTDAATHRVLALRGYVGMIHAAGSGLSAEEKLQMCSAALDAARELDVKRQVLGALGGIHVPKALSLAMSQMDEPGLAEEAGAAAVAVAAALAGADKAAVRAAMLQVIGNCRNRRTRDNAQRVLAKYAP